MWIFSDCRSFFQGVLRSKASVVVMLLCELFSDYKCFFQGVSCSKASVAFISISILATSIVYGILFGTLKF